MYAICDIFLVNLNYVAVCSMDKIMGKGVFWSKNSLGQRMQLGVEVLTKLAQGPDSVSTPQKQNAFGIFALT